MLVCMKEICGFLNSGGGYIFIGINDNPPYNLTGMQRDYDVSSSLKKDFEDLQGKISAKIRACLFFPEKRSKIRVSDFIEIRNCIIDDVEIVGIFINPWPERNCLYRESASSTNAELIFRDGAHKNKEEIDSHWIKDSSRKKWMKTHR